jgi:tetratricopeptide (TPR) repeat protein
VKIDASLDPELYAGALLATGLAHTAAGSYEQARTWLQSSLDFHVQVFGPEHASIIDCLVHLAEALRRLGKLDAAREHIKRAVRLARTGKGSSSIQLGLALNELAALELHHNNLIAAFPAAEESKRLLEAADDPRRTLPTGTLALIHFARGEFAEARAIYEELLRSSAKLYLGVNHPRYVAHLHDFATVLQAQGELPGAAKEFKKVIASIKQLYGDSYPDLAAVYANLGRLEQSRKKFADAQTHFVAAQKLSKKLLGEQHPFYGYDLANLGRLALDQGNAKVALGFLNEALDIYRNAFQGEAHVYTASALTFLGYALLDLNKPEAAKKAVEEAVQQWQRIAALCNDQAGDAGACDRAFAKILLECTDAACKSKKDPVLLHSDDSSTLDGKLQAGDIRRRLLSILSKKGLIQQHSSRDSDSDSPQQLAAAGAN